ncbi:MAG: hypothetical protein DDT19_02494 [Syntrophomonadaceae bacterium]|nr:hypothetical protein [Bacillota bacterium]
MIRLAKVSDISKLLELSKLSHIKPRIGSWWTCRRTWEKWIGKRCVYLVIRNREIAAFGAKYKYHIYATVSLKAGAGLELLNSYEPLCCGIVSHTNKAAYRLYQVAGFTKILTLKLKVGRRFKTFYVVQKIHSICH